MTTVINRAMLNQCWDWGLAITIPGALILLLATVMLSYPLEDTSLQQPKDSASVEKTPINTHRDTPHENQETTAKKHTINQ